MSDEQQLWSVTSFEKLGLPMGRGLLDWNVRTPCETAYDKLKTLTAYHEDGDREGAVDWLMRSRFQKSGKAKARGTDVHVAAEQYALGQTPEVEDHILPYVEQYRRFLDEHQPEFLMAEAPVYNPTYGYAGTCDGVIKLQGDPVVFDIKTTEYGPDAVTASGRPKMRQPFPEAALQITAYRRAELVGVLAERREVQNGRYYIYDPELHHEPMPETTGGVCLAISPFDYRLIPVQTSDEIWNVFRHVMEVARWNIFTSQSVFGPPIAPPVEVAA